MSGSILCLDFDGVIHSYGSGWQGAVSIPDDPVPGAMEFILDAMEEFEVHIHSTRSKHPFGRWAMKKWLTTHMGEFLFDIATSEKLVQHPLALTVMAERMAENHIDDCVRAASDIVDLIHWPLFKPPAMVTLDDRAVTFTGEFPPVSELRDFKPWNRRRA